MYLTVPKGLGEEALDVVHRDGEEDNVRYTGGRRASELQTRYARGGAREHAVVEAVGAGYVFVHARDWLDDAVEDLLLEGPAEFCHGVTPVKGLVYRTGWALVECVVQGVAELVTEESGLVRF